MPNSFDHGGTVFAAARQLGVSPSELTDFSASISPLGLSPQVRKSIICTMDSVIHYPDCTNRELKSALSLYHGVSPSHFAVGNGSTELIYHLPGLFPAGKALVVSPAFSEYMRSLGQHRWEVDHFMLSPENNFSIDLKKLGAELEKGYGMLFLCNPANPSGTLYPLSLVEDLYRMCISTGTFLVLDEAFMDFCEEHSAKGIAVNGDNAIVLRSMTKFFGIPGLRLGYAMASANIVNRLDSMGGPWSVNSIAQAAGAAALKDVEYNRELLDFIRLERRDLFDRLSQFPTLKVIPSNANFLLVEIRSGMTASELKDRLFPQRILIRDCSTFVGLGIGYFRVAVKTRKENDRLVAALKRILK